MIEIDGLTKRYGDKTAVDGLSFVVEPGVVTGFLGPNGAGKSTTMRMIAGLDRPTSGTVRVNGKHYPGAAAPMAELGILLDARSVHPGLSARNNLLALARTAGIGRRRVDEVIELAGLAEVAGARAGGFSLGMGQRLGVAAAPLGRPQTVVLDEPVNGLDPDGVRWIRLLLKSLAAEGRTVFVSSHLMSEMAQTATRLVVLGRGRQAPAPAVTGPATVAGPVTQVRVVRAEWTKLRALRSTWWCALSAIVLIVGLGAVIAGSGAPYKVSAGNSAAVGVSASLLGLLFAQLVIGVIGVLAFSGEYATGMIRATLAVVPSRLPVLWAKLIVLVGLVLPLTLLCAVADFFTATALESSRGGSAISLTDPGVLRTVVGASLYLTVVVVIGLALGALLRRTAAGLSVFAALFFVVPIVVGALPHKITGFAPYLPSNAGGALWGNPLTTGHELGPWAGFAVLCGYAIVLTGLAAWRLRRRDA